MNGVKELVRAEIGAIIIGDNYECDVKKSKQICNGIKAALKTKGVSMKYAKVLDATCNFYELRFYAKPEDMGEIFDIAKELGGTNIEFKWSDTQ